MEYYAGLFDAEGCISLTPMGSIKVRLNNTRKSIPDLFQKRFGGTIYKETKTAKTMWNWYLNAENIVDFCSQIIPYSRIKRKQLELLLSYKNSNRVTRRENRKDIIHRIASYKKPLQVSHEYFTNPDSIIPDEPFFKWLAGFIEGDGSIRIYSQSHNHDVFTTNVAISNTFAEPILYVFQRIQGGITLVKSHPHNMWRWVCSEKAVKPLLISLMPYLYVMKEQAQLILDFLEIKYSKNPTHKYTYDQINSIRDIVNKVKHLNSL